MQQYENWADYVEEVKMIKTSRAVVDVSSYVKEYPPAERLF